MSCAQPVPDCKITFDTQVLMYCNKQKLKQMEFIFNCISYPFILTAHLQHVSTSAYVFGCPRCFKKKSLPNKNPKPHDKIGCLLLPLKLTLQVEWLFFCFYSAAIQNRYKWQKWQKWQKWFILPLFLSPIVMFRHKTMCFSFQLYHIKPNVWCYLWLELILLLSIKCIYTISYLSIQ